MQAKFKKYKVSTLFIAVMFTTSTAQASLERRMVIEVKPQAVHFAIADVNPENNKIYRHLDNGFQSYSINTASNDMDSNLPTFESIAVLQQIFQKLHRRKEHFQVKKIKAVAPNDLISTSRVDSLQKEILRKSNINLKILTDKERDQIDFFSLISTAEREHELTALVIGNSNIDLVIANPETRIATYKIPTGTACFMTYLKEVVQKRKHQDNRVLTSMSTSEIQLGIDYSRYLIRRLPPEIINQLNHQKIHLLLNHSFSNSPELLNEHQEGKGINKENVQYYLAGAEAIQPLSRTNSKNMESNFANAILLLGLMQEFEAETVHMIQRNSTIDLLEFPLIWH